MIFQNFFIFQKIIFKTFLNFQKHIKKSYRFLKMVFHFFELFFQNLFFEHFDFVAIFRGFFKFHIF